MRDLVKPSYLIVVSALFLVSMALLMTGCMDADGPVERIQAQCQDYGDTPPEDPSGDGSDSSICPDGYNVIEGTDGDDVLEGTPGNDCILGHGGNDVIRGGDGDDYLLGGDGDDSLYGENGKDALFGGAGDDLLDLGNGADLPSFGGSGDDTILTGNGADSVVSGGPGDDFIDAANGKDTAIYGGEGHDVLEGGNGRDRIHGGGGNDLIVGGRGRDELDGDGCHDVILGGGGRDVAAGGDGFDACDGAGCEVGESQVDDCSQDADCGTGYWCVTQVGLCAPWEPDGSDGAGLNICDGVDGDCDDLIDEDYVSVPTDCGVGACYATGAIVCVEGAEIDTCTPGAPAADDAVCNGIDDDCDGMVDEDYVSLQTTCGAGACLSTGATSCVDGSVEDDCDPTSAIPDDGNPCTIDVCDGELGEQHLPAPEGTPCGGGQTCTAGGQCGPVWTDFIGVASNSTFLRSRNDIVSAPAIVPLSDLDVLAGDSITIKQEGDYQGWAGGPQVTLMVAVFSSSPILLDPETQYRVPGAIACGGPPIDTGTTWLKKLPTDIPEDFIVFGDGTTVTVPQGASYLLVGTADSYYRDNDDPENDFGFRIKVGAN